MESCTGSPWEVATPVKVNLEQSGAPVNCMTAIHGRLWCGCHCNAVVLDTSTLAVEVGSFSPVCMLYKKHPFGINRSL